MVTGLQAQDQVFPHAYKVGEVQILLIEIV